MSIYNRDNIPYQNMIDSMIRNRAEKGKLMGDNWRKQGEIWGGFAKDTGALAGRTMDALQAQEESPENILKKLEEELAEAKAAEKWETKPTGFNDYAEAKLQEKLRRDIQEQEAARALQDEAARQAGAQSAFIGHQAADMRGYRPNMAGYSQYMDTLQDMNDTYNSYYDDIPGYNNSMNILAGLYRRR